MERRLHSSGGIRRVATATKVAVAPCSMESEVADKTKPEPLNDGDLDSASGGVLIGLLLPAVQKMPAPGSELSAPTTNVAAGPGAGPHIKSADGTV